VEKKFKAVVTRTADLLFFEHLVDSQICVAFAVVATALHCERSCARENVSVRDMPVSEEM